MYFLLKLGILYSNVMLVFREVRLINKFCNLEFVSEAVSDYGLIDSTGIMVVFYLFSNHQKRHQTKQISVFREGEGEI